MDDGPDRLLGRKVGRAGVRKHVDQLFAYTVDAMNYTIITHTGWHDDWAEHAGMEFNENWAIDTGALGFHGRTDQVLLVSHMWPTA